MLTCSFRHATRPLFLCFLSFIFHTHDKGDTYTVPDNPAEKDFVRNVDKVQDVQVPPSFFVFLPSIFHIHYKANTYPVPGNAAETGAVRDNAAEGTREERPPGVVAARHSLCLV
jgi:hypothetical protein